MAGFHDPPDAFDAVVDETKGACLSAVSPDLNGRTVFRLRHLPANRRGGFLASALVRAQGSVHVVKAHDPHVEVIVLMVVAGQLFGEELLPAVPHLRVRGDGVLLAQRRDVLPVLEKARIDAGRGRVEVAFDALQAGRFEHVGIDEGVVPGQPGVEFRDVANPAHVRRELIDVLDAEDRVGAAVERPEVCDHELVGETRLELGPFQVHAPDPESVGLQPLDEVVADETTGPRNEGPSSFVSVCHGVTLLATRFSQDCRR